MASVFKRLTAKGRRTMAAAFRRRILRVQAEVPLISFTFDDAPCSAFDIGREILEAHGARATYFMSLGLLGQVTEIVTIADVDRLRGAVASGHELGCHTFDHLDAWDVSARRYIASVDANRAALQKILPDTAFRTFAYPKSGATLAVKAELERRFDCCRGGGQGVNTGFVDLNLLNACFLDVRAGVDFAFVQQLIDRNARERGWLIFAAHDIADRGSVFRSAPAFFENVVSAAARSGAQLVPMVEACRALSA